MTLIWLCIKIFLVRIVDVSLGTIRTIYTVKDKFITAATFGFFEVLVWFLIAKDALNSDNNNMIIAICYSLGFATGTYVGGILSKYFTRNSTLSVQIIIPKKDITLIDLLHQNNFAVSVLQVSGYHEDNKLLLFLEIDSSRLKELKNFIAQIDDNAFVVISDSRAVYNGYFNTISK